MFYKTLYTRDIELDTFQHPPRERRRFEKNTKNTGKTYKKNLSKIAANVYF